MLFVYLASVMQKDLSQRKESEEFYEQRYIHGYMGHWSAFEKQRLLQLIRELNLGPRGKALDFGCGRGIFTEVLKEALPGWDVYGCDISAEAVRYAAEHSRGINFFLLNDSTFSGLKFDFIHSHHVLEHTFDYKITAKEMCSFAAPVCVMLHSLPCNHQGSLEHKLASHRINGIDGKTGKFFFEDPAHMQRLSASEAEQLFAPEGFHAWKKYFANQYYGAMKWIAESNLKLVVNIANPLRAKNFSSFLYLSGKLLRLKLLWFSFFTASAFEPADKGKHYFLKRVIQAACFILFFWFAIPIRTWMMRKAREEWNLYREDNNGSDLFLILRRE
jgi:2-polyprenyl-3-methyl-5-hydroxy-6-metoxy-1,4-benzoquinol methylase